MGDRIAERHGAATSAPWDAVILAGGRARRLGGIDKPGLRLDDGRSLLQRALAATGPARVRVVVGAVRDAPADVRLVLETPRFGGPVVALAAGIAALPDGAALVAVLAADQPRVEAAMPLLLAAGEQAAAGGVIAVDPDGRDQPLLALLRRRPLASALEAVARRRGDLTGAALRDVVALLALTRVPLPAALCADVDTPADADAAGIRLPARPTRPTRPTHLESA